MVELLRDQTRQYAVDKSAAIKTQNIAAAIQDVGTVAGAASSIAKGVGQIRSELSASEVEDAKDAASKAQAELAKKNAEMIQTRGRPMTEQEFRETGDKLFSEAGANFKWSEARKTFDQSNREFVRGGIADNIRYMTQTKAAARATKATQNADASMNDLLARAAEYGDQGNTTALESLTTEGTATIVKNMGSAIVGDEQRKTIAAAIGSQVYERHNLHLAGSSTAGAEIVDGRMSNNEQFLAAAPSGYKDNFIGVMRDHKRAELQQQIDAQTNRLATMEPKSADYKQAEKQLKSMQSDIKDFDSRKGKYESFDDDVITRERETQAKTMIPKLRQMLGERTMEARKAAYQGQQSRAGEFVRYADPRYISALEQLAGQENNMTKIDKKTGMAVSEPEMSYLDGMKPKEFWQGVLDNARTYETEMSRVSPIIASAPADQAQVNYELGKLLTMKPTDEFGNPADFQAAAIGFLSRMARAPLTESERRDYQDLVGQFMTANDSEIQNARDLLMSGDVGIYAKGRQESGRGSGGDPEYSQGLLGQLPEEKRGGQVFVDTRRSIFNPKASEFDNTGGFDNMIRRTQATYQTKAVNAMRTGVSRDQIMQMRREMFSSAINQWYSDRYVIDLHELDRKVQNKEPAFQELDGIIYEYKGRDSIGRPVWKDNAILNTNKDFTRLNQSSRIMNPGFEGNGTK